MEEFIFPYFELDGEAGNRVPREIKVQAESQEEAAEKAAVEFQRRLSP